MMVRSPVVLPVACPSVELSTLACTPLLICAIDTDAENCVLEPCDVVSATARPSVVLSPPASACTVTSFAVIVDCVMLAVVMSALNVTATAPAMPTVFWVPGAPFDSAAEPLAVSMIVLLSACTDTVLLPPVPYFSVALAIEAAVSTLVRSIAALPAPAVELPPWTLLVFLLAMPL